MKTVQILLIAFSITSLASAEFESWTNKEGKSVELDLIKVTQVAGEVQGEFKMRNGKTATIKVSDLSQTMPSALLSGSRPQPPRLPKWWLQVCSISFSMVTWWRSMASR